LTGFILNNTKNYKAWLKTAKKRKVLLLLCVFISFFPAMPCESAEVVIVGDTRLSPVYNTVRAIESIVPNETKVYLPDDVKGRLNVVVAKEGAKLVIALGGDALNLALHVPESVPVVYGLVIKPMQTKRQNITGVYMATPVSEYISFLNKYFPNIKRIGIVYEHETIDISDPAALSQVFSYKASNPYEFIKGVNTLGRNVDAILLLPDKNLLTSTALEELYRYSFARKIPVIGISEKHVKMGSLFTLVFDDAAMGMQIGELAKTVLSQGEAASIQPSPPERFNLYINTETAKAMKISIPSEVMKKAKKVYP
jgi:ABC-type uncharacterized transport system substrate-binding protein